jgi:CHAT domain-containing protein
LLGSAKTIDSLIVNYRQHFQQLDRQEHLPTHDDLGTYDSLAQRLYATLWGPLENVIDRYKTVLISPDGAVNLVSFAGLRDSQGRYLVENHTIHYLSAGRDLLRMRTNAQTHVRLLAIGDPDFDAPVADRILKLANRRETIAFSMDGGNMKRSRGAHSNCQSVYDLHMQRLPGTRREIELIRKNSIFGGNVVSLLDAEASEDNFKLLAPRASTIHLATHGYYLKTDCSHRQIATGASPAGTMELKNPLLNSGLFLAGGNLHGQGADSASLEDGILTAEEISLMDLDGLELVVLSACETGLGDVQNGEGVYGLRRAFQAAGANSIVSALWSVPDEETSQLMQHLYKSSAEGIAERIRQAQLTQISKMRRDGDPTHPYLWAGFISVGEWR